uniref:Uncharacterized protein n=1 Tax=Myoviridae sp. ctgXa1 TaxID=2827700 RepID=A0A8S5T6Y0_9CAUD|nr:MAG TPA: hypothetical protein [Myoviridae sp. ctgXa1]
MHGKRTAARWNPKRFLILLGSAVRPPFHLFIA